MAAAAESLKNKIIITQSASSPSYSSSSSRACQSALFTFIEREGKSLKRKYSIVKSTNADRAVFYLTLKNNPDSFINLYGDMGYELKGRHLSIDKLYARDTNEKGVR